MIETAKQYYFLSYSTGDDIGSRYPQTDGLGDTASRADIDNLRSFTDSPPINLDSILLYSKAKVTDFISHSIFSSSGLLISEKVKQILINYKIPHHRFFPAVIETKKKKLDNYYWLHFLEDDTTRINFQQCELSTFRPAPEDLPGWNYAYERVDIRDHVQFMETLKGIAGRRRFTTNQLSLQSLLEKRDLLTLRGFDQSVLISADLKNTFEAAGITGWEVKEGFPICFG